MSEITEKAKELIKILKIIPQHKTTSLELSIDREGERFNVGLKVTENNKERYNNQKIYSFPIDEVVGVNLISLSKDYAADLKPYKIKITINGKVIVEP